MDGSSVPYNLMASILNRPAFEQLLKEDLEWLATTPRTLEREHIKAVLEERLRLPTDLTQHYIKDHISVMIDDPESVTRLLELGLIDPSIQLS